MFFQNITDPDLIASWVKKMVIAMQAGATYGFDVDVKPHKKTRTYLQNRYLMAVLQHIVQFYQETGFIPVGLSPWAMRTDVLKVYFKARFGIAETSKLSTREFGEFVDNIQREMVESTAGEYEMIIPPDNYLEITGIV